MGMLCTCFGVDFAFGVTSAHCCAKNCWPEVVVQVVAVACGKSAVDSCLCACAAAQALPVRQRSQSAEECVPASSCSTF